MRHRLALVLLALVLPLLVRSDAPACEPKEKTARVYELAGDWTASQRRDFLNARPNIWIGFGSFKEYLLPSPIGTAIGTAVNALQELKPTAKVLFQDRPDLFTKYKPNYAGQDISIDGVMRGYCGAGNSNCAGWPAGFNTAWILRGSKSEAIADIDARFDAGVGGLDARRDPWATCTYWSSAVDCAAIQALVTDTTVPQLYAQWNPTPQFGQTDLFIGSVAMDLTNATYRSWRIAYTLATLDEYGIANGEPAALFFGPKTGWWAYEADAAANYRGCRAGNDRSYAGRLWGPTKPAECPDYAGWTASPLFRTPYTEGAYEAARDAYFTELIAALDADPDYAGVCLIVQRAPPGWNDAADREETLAEELPTLANSPRFCGTFVNVVTP